MSYIQIDDGQLIIRVPVEPDGTISVNRFNQLFPNATAFLFKINQSNNWAIIEKDDNGNFLAPDGIWNGQVVYKAYDSRSPRRRSSSSSLSVTWNRFLSTFGTMLMLWFVSPIPSLYVNIYEEMIKLCSSSLWARILLVVGLSMICIGLGTVTFRWVSKQLTNWWNGYDDE